MIFRDQQVLLLGEISISPAGVSMSFLKYFCTSLPEQGKRSCGCAGITVVTPNVNFLPNLGDERRQQFIVGRRPHCFIRRKPALLRNQRREWRNWKIRVESHINFTNRSNPALKIKGLENV